VSHRIRTSPPEGGTPNDLSHHKLKVLKATAVVVVVNRAAAKHVLHNQQLCIHTGFRELKLVGSRARRLSVEVRQAVELLTEARYDPH